MNKGHIQAERAEAIAKAMNTGTPDNVENVNRERTVSVDKLNPFFPVQCPFLATRKDGSPLCRVHSGDRFHIHDKEGMYVASVDSWSDLIGALVRLDGKG